MRMWKVDPKLMCRQHLLGEHLEMHMFMGCIVNGSSIDGYIRNGLVEVHNIRKRHDELAEEMIGRGYNHKSPMSWEANIKVGVVDVTTNYIELLSRCSRCRERKELAHGPKRKKGEV